MPDCGGLSINLGGKAPDMRGGSAFSGADSGPRGIP